MALAVYGKHPAKGDFLEAGIPPSLKGALEGWLDAVMAEARADLGPAWEQVWRDAPVLRFWLGEAIWGQPVAGVMATSQDRVGRRFPLVLMCAGTEAAQVPAPTIGNDGGWYDAMAAHLAAGLARRDLTAPSDLVTGVVLPVAVENQPEPGPDAFWAVRPGASVAELLADIALTDHRRAVTGRSYWWVAGQDAPVDEPAMTAAPADSPEVETAGQEPEVPEGAGPEGDGPENDRSELAGPERAQTPEPAPEAGVAAPEADAWDLPMMSAQDDSPFASEAGFGMFAAPMAADPVQRAAPVVVVMPMSPPVPRLLYSQVWAGSGLPSGQILAWFLRGVSANA